MPLARDGNADALLRCQEGHGHAGAEGAARSRIAGPHRMRGRVPSCVQPWGRLAEAVQHGTFRRGGDAALRSDVPGYDLHGEERPALDGAQCRVRRLLVPQVTLIGRFTAMEIRV